MKLSLEILATLCGIVLFSARFSDAANTFLPVSADLAENSATVSTTLTGSGGTPPYTFAIDAQVPNLAWFLISTAGVISLATGKTVNYEEATLASFLYKIDVEIVDSAGTPTTATVTFTYTITNVNEAPVFGSDAYAMKFTASQAAGSTIGTVAATDPESGTLTYSIDDTSTFAISTSGVVTVKTGVTLSSATKYTEVYAADDATTALTATTYLFVCVGTTCTCSAAAAITGSVVTAIGVLVTLLMKFT